MGRWKWLVLAALPALVSCQNWDMLQPDPSQSSSRSFTPLGEAPQTLTNAVAVQRLEAIRAASGGERLRMIDQFLEEYPRARLLPDVHTLTGEAHLAAGDEAVAADSFERAVVLSRSDLLGVPLDVDLVVKLGLARVAAGQLDDGTAWLVRASFVDASPRLDQALRWSHSETGGPAAEFDEWLAARQRQRAVVAPEFTLPGLQQETVTLSSAKGRATLINFWSPT